MEEILVKESNGLPALLTSDQLLHIAEQAEARVEALNTIKLVALRTTNPKDWTDHNGKPWLQESGASKVGRLFGVSWTIPDDPVYEQFEDGHFQYTYKAIFSLADISIEAIGTRQSKDGFFNTRYQWDPNKNKKVPFDLPPSEIDKGDVKKAAYANCVERGITTILGIKNLTWEEIEEHTNIKKNQVTSIQYGKSTNKGRKPSPEGQNSFQKAKTQKSKGTPPPKQEKAFVEVMADIEKEFETVDQLDAFQEALRVHQAEWDDKLSAYTYQSIADRDMQEKVYNSLKKYLKTVKEKDKENIKT